MHLKYIEILRQLDFDIMEYNLDCEFQQAILDNNISLLDKLITNLGNDIYISIILESISYNRIEIFNAYFDKYNKLSSAIGKDWCIWQLCLLNLCYEYNGLMEMEREVFNSCFRRCVTETELSLPIIAIIKEYGLIDLLEDIIY
jgi:hypothetical protein